MTDPRYAESAAYHEAGHVVVAAVLGLRLSRHGMHLDHDGKGISFYKLRKPSSSPCVGPAVNREHTIISILAGLIAQEKFCPNCSKAGADDDEIFINILLNEVHSDSSALSVAQGELRGKSLGLVNEHWGAIEELAKALWSKPIKPRRTEPDSTWSQSPQEKRIDGSEIVKILQGFGVCASIFDDLPGDDGPYSG